MYFKLLYIAFLIYISSQVNLAKPLQQCTLCQSSNLCPTAQSNANDQSLPINISNDTGLSETFAILTTIYKKIVVVLDSCDENAIPLAAIKTSRLEEIREAVGKSPNEKIEFSNSNKCFTIETIKKQVKKILDKVEGDERNRLQIDIPDSSLTDEQGLQSLGENRYVLNPNCGDKEAIVQEFETREEARMFVDRIVQQLNGIQIQLGVGICVTFKEIADKIKAHYIKYYPDKKSAIDGVSIPVNIRETDASATPPTAEIPNTVGLLKYENEYMTADDCTATRTMKIWDVTDAENRVKTWTKKIVDLITPVLT